MSTTSLQVIPENMKTSIIRIYSYDDKNPQGTFYNLYYGEEIAFGNLTRLLLLMEDMMNSMDCPQSAVHSRRFGKIPKAPEQISMPQQPIMDKSVIATFTVRVMSSGSKLAGKALLAGRRKRTGLSQHTGTD